MDFLKLIDQGRHTAIVNHVAKCKCLSTEEELALIDRGNHEEIMTYITRHYFEPDSLEKFIKRGKLDEVRHYLSCHQVVYDNMWKQIIKLGSGVLNEVIDYILRERNRYIDEQPDPKHFNDEKFLETWEEVIELILYSGNHCTLRRLITQTRLTGNLESILNTYGSAEDKLVYHLKWDVLNHKN